MTEGRRRRGPGPSIVILSSVAAFLAILAFLAFQLRMGRDPALAKPTKLVEVKPQPQRVVVRKIVRRYVITRVIPAPEQPYAGPAVAAATPVASPGGAAPAPSGAPAPASAPAPAPQAPAAAPPAPAPAPAPVTRSS
jgi:hypothetical protein